MPHNKKILCFLLPLTLLSGCASEPANGLSPNQQAALAFMKQNLATPGIHQQSSGLQYLVLMEGTGLQPTTMDRVTAYYRGYFPNDTTFDETPPGKPATFELGMVIPGWQEGLSLMREGAKYRFFIPPHLGYGSRGMEPKIPPDQMLIFDVELLRVEKLKPLVK